VGEDHTEAQKTRLVLAIPPWKSAGGAASRNIARQKREGFRAARSACAIKAANLLPGLVAARELLSRRPAAGGGICAGRLDDLGRVVFGRNALASPGVSAFLLAHLSGLLGRW
jgi:hypothetical protein